MTVGSIGLYTYSSFDLSILLWNTASMELLLASGLSDAQASDAKRLEIERGAGGD